MFEWLFGKRKREPKIQPGQAHMPQVELVPDIEKLMAQAREAAAGKTPVPNADGRQVVIVTPGRLLMFKPCPPPGSMPGDQVAAIEKMLPPDAQRNVVAIACTELDTLMRHIELAIPFFGFLLGFAYVGHAVWVFEGHSTALAAGCREADLLIADGAMVHHLQDDWQTVAAGAMRHPEIYIHDRRRFALRKVS